MGFYYSHFCCCCCCSDLFKLEKLKKLIPTQINVSKKNTGDKLMELLETSVVKKFSQMSKYICSLSSLAFPKFILVWDTPFSEYIFMFPQNHRWENKSDYISLEGGESNSFLKTLESIHIKTYVFIKTSCSYRKLSILDFLNWLFNLFLK